MKKFANRMMVFGLIFGSTMTMALAQSIKKQVTFFEPVKVNGVVVKAGTYDAAFDEESGQLIISKGKRIIAKAPARLEKLDKDSRSVYALWDVGGNTKPKVLTSVTLKDGNQAKLMNAGDTKAEGAQ